METVKLFWCPKCQKHVPVVKATALVRGVELNVNAQAIAQGAATATGDDWYTVPFERISDITCVKCGKPVELQELDACPHDWVGTGTIQQCALCQAWRGRVAFD